MTVALEIFIHKFLKHMLQKQIYVIQSTAISPDSEWVE